MAISIQKPGPRWQKLWKWTSVFLASEIILFCSNAILALIYKKYEWQVGPVNQLFYFGLTLLIVTLSRRWSQKLDQEMAWETGISRRLVTQLLLSFGLTLFVVTILRNAIISLFSHESRYIRVGDEWVISLVFIGFILVIALIDLGIFLMQQWRETATEAERVRKENMEFRFDRLRNQINPHFLFNSLNTLASLVYQSPETASQFVRQLARVYRYVLENRDKELISLAEEWEFIEAYLFLVKIRFDEGLRFEIQIPEEARRNWIAPMTLQLLIENALKHNIVSFSKPLKVSIRVSGDWLIVENNLQLKSSPEPGTKTGLDNIKTRYAMMTGRQVKVEQTAEIFKVEIPLLGNAETDIEQK